MLHRDLSLVSVMGRPFVVAIVLFVGVVAVSCRADDTVKQGADGEYCNGFDDDCREGHVCENGICVATNSGTITCGQMCRRLVECERVEENCEANCRLTIGGECESLPCPWSAEAVDAFGRCITEELTCEEARQDDAPSICYRRIPISSDRELRCEAFIAAADRCNPGVNTTNLRDRCFMLGRTTVEDSWLRTDGCVNRVDGGLCSEIADCYNAVFDLEPAISLGNGTIGGGQIPPGEPSEPLNNIVIGG